MKTYLVRWQANASEWPLDPKEVQAVWEAACSGANAMLESGAFKEIRWLSGTSGYGIVEGESKADALAVVTPFFPYFSQTVEEAVPWEAGRDAVLAAARQMTGGA